MTAIAIIPARYNSSRLPGKPLRKIGKYPLVQIVYQKVARAQLVDQVIVATDDERVVEAVRAFEGKVVLTSENHESGTERIAEIGQLVPYDIIVNVQVDEPLIQPQMIDELIRIMVDKPGIRMSTIAVPMQDLDYLDDPNVVKVVVDQNGFALYFSRSPIPYPFIEEYRNSTSAKEVVSYRNELIKIFRQHVGVYAYRKSFLLQYVKLPRTPLEKLESLEQLRALEHGYRIYVMTVDHSFTLSVDTEHDLKRVRELFRAHPGAFLPERI